jgi:hypothetical protein
MAGRPLYAAKHAATRFAELLGQNDRLSITVFDDDVATIFGPAPAATTPRVTRSPAYSRVLRPTSWAAEQRRLSEKEEGQS